MVNFRLQRENELIQGSMRSDQREACGKVLRIALATNVDFRRGIQKAAITAVIVGFHAFLFFCLNWSVVERSNKSSYSPSFTVVLISAKNGQARPHTEGRDPSAKVNRRLEGSERERNRTQAERVQGKPLAKTAEAASPLKPTEVSGSALRLQAPRDAIAEVVPPAENGASGAPLKLELPKDRTVWGWSNPAVEHQIGSGGPRSFESKLAGALGTGQWVEERLDNDRVRFRDGSRCVTMTRQRTAMLDPFNSQRLPWLVSAPEPC